MYLNQLGWNESQVSGPPRFAFDTSKRFHFLDEIHELNQPEALYPYLSSGNFVVILATNQTGDLLEPLRNRCQYVFEFDRYSQDELHGMCSNLFSIQGFPNLPGEIVSFVVERSGGIPRILRNLILRFSVLFRSGERITVGNLERISQEILNLDRNGLGPHERMYIEFLKSAGGSASLSLIASGTGLTESTIRRIVEPGLIHRGILSISSRGRSLVPL